MPNSILEMADCLITDEFKCKPGKLEEIKENMSIPIKGEGVNYKLFTFDRNLDNKTYPKGLYPFFQKTAGAHSVCDYMILVTSGAKVFVLLVELKKGESATAPQLKAGECMAKFIIDTINRLNKSTFKPEYRKITVRNTNIVRKGKTKIQPIEYVNNCAIFKGRYFYLNEFLK